ncbi:MAG: TOMM precursor leader peptide-binding protein [Planctomycetes bacterium]|nr:TOMM precursor leader peptide-binding protein [Planctomycetota bacterium]
MTASSGADAWGRRRLRLALPFTVIAEPGVVRLIAGEDHRYTLRADGVERWLPPVLAALDGDGAVADAVARAPGREAEADALLRRLLGERALVDDAPRLVAPRRFALVVEGQGGLFDRVAAGAGGEGEALAVLCQDRHDLAAALDFHARALAAGHHAIWATTGPLGRGWVSPLLLPGDGACLACLVLRFRGLSPAPELYDALVGHARRGGEVRPSPFPARGEAVLAELLLWKVELAAAPAPPPALYRLHVLDAGALAVSEHRVAREPGCEACRPWR